ncbi:hypothetical protein [Kibdelosporangium philippinense]|uniref:hypothetical protein n=1 Tax=Kibdelosporangium philippinense TaxID=211113 RepID=UPI003611BD57
MRRPHARDTVRLAELLGCQVDRGDRRKGWAAVPASPESTVSVHQTMAHSSES